MVTALLGGCSLWARPELWHSQFLGSDRPPQHTHAVLGSQDLWARREGRRGPQWLAGDASSFSEWIYWQPNRKRLASPRILLIVPFTFNVTWY